MKDDLLIGILFLMGVILLAIISIPYILYDIQ